MRVWIGILGLLVSAASSAVAAAEFTPQWPQETRAPEGAPNVLIWMIDDMGFAHPGAFGGLVETPQIDRVAQSGLRYSAFHSTSLCSPSRAALLTGRNHHAVNVGTHAKAAAPVEGYQGRIPRSAATIARILQRSGYATYALGKWDHLPAEHVSPAGPFDYWPSGQGFDRYYGFLAADANNFSPSLWRDHAPVEPAVGRPDYHVSQDLADEAIQWISELQAADPARPFFMYWATGAVHAPHHAPQADIEHYRGRFDAGWDAAREKILARQKQLGVAPRIAELSPRPVEIPAWDSLPPEARRLYARQMEVFAAQLTHADREFGRILAALERAGELENTLVIVTSDNGASGEGGPAGTFNEMLLMNQMEATLEQNLPLLERWGGPETYPHYAIGWAMAGNTPFQFYKQSAHEGGVHDPLVISWPRRIRARGEIRSQYHHMVDLMPTLLGQIGIPLPAEVDGIAQQPLDGIDMSYSFADATAATRKRVQYYEMFGNRGLWADGWKAVVLHNRKPWNVFSAQPYESDVWELYHTDADWSESRDLANENPAKLAELEQLFERTARANHVLPLAPSAGGWSLLTRQHRLEAARAHGGRYVFRPPAHRIADELAPPFTGHSYTLTARVVVPKGGAEGVLASQGGRFGGWSLYLKDGRPTYHYGFLGLGHYAMRADAPLPPGRTELRLEFRTTQPLQGMATLYVGKQKLAETSIEHLVPAMYGLNESFDLGRDDGSSTSPDYAPPFAFTGVLEEVVVQLDLE